MIQDKQTLLSNAQAVTATAASENVIDLGKANAVYGEAAAVYGDVGKGRQIPLLIQVVEAFATLTSLTVTIETDDNSGFSSAATKWTSGAIPLASLVAGYRFLIDFIPRGINERYMRLKYTVAGSDATTGKITAGVTMGNATDV